MVKLKVKKQTTPKLVREGGLTEQWKKGRFEVVQQPDEENPKRTVERIRVKETYNSLKMITDHQKKLALRYALLVERADGATPDILANVRLYSTGQKIWEPTHARLIAIEELRKIKFSIGEYHMEILDLMIIKNMNCKDIAEYKKYNQSFTAGVVMSAFINLEKAFEEVDND